MSEMGEKEAMTQGVASRSVTSVEDPGVAGSPQPAEGKAIVEPVIDPVGASGERASGPLYVDPTNAGVMPQL